MLDFIIINAEDKLVKFLGVLDEEVLEELSLIKFEDFINLFFVLVVVEFDIFTFDIGLVLFLDFKFFDDCVDEDVDI